MKGGDVKSRWCVSHKFYLVYGLWDPCFKGLRWAAFLIIVAISAMTAKEKMPWEVTNEASARNTVPFWISYCFEAERKRFMLLCIFRVKGYTNLSIKLSLLLMVQIVHYYFDNQYLSLLSTLCLCSF